jgi:hypothetical protein
MDKSNVLKSLFSGGKHVKIYSLHLPSPQTLIWTSIAGFLFLIKIWHYVQSTNWEAHPNAILIFWAERL